MDMLLYFGLERDWIPMVVDVTIVFLFGNSRHGSPSSGTSRSELIMLGSGRWWCRPFNVLARALDPPVPVDVGVKDRGAMSSFGWKDLVVVVHVQAKKENAFGVFVIGRFLHDYSPGLHVALAHKHLIAGMKVGWDVLELR